MPIFKKSISQIMVLLLAFMLLTTNCNKKEDQTPELTAAQELNEIIYRIMKTESWYLWYENVPDNDPMQFADSYDYFYSMLYYEMDKWSYMTTEEAHDAYYEQGTYYGHGFGFKWDPHNKLMVSFVFDSSPLKAEGVTRGCEIVAINNVPTPEVYNNDLLGSIFGPNEPGHENSMTIVNLQADTFDLTVPKIEITQNTVMHTQVYELGARKIGYLVFKGFIEPSVAELDAAFDMFLSENIDGLVIDLRYNGGGRLDVANHLASQIAGKKANGEIIEKLQHNETKTEKDVEAYFEILPNSLDLQNVAVITTGGTASASEIIINGLKPHIPLVTIGSKSHGKPVGMYSFRYGGHVMVPICFKVVNSQGQGDYFDGIEADAERPDDLNHDWGDPEEACLQEALYYMENGNFSDAVPAKKAQSKTINLSGLRAFIGAW